MTNRNIDLYQRCVTNLVVVILALNLVSCAAVQNASPYVTQPGSEKCSEIYQEDIGDGMELTREEIEMLLTSLEYTKRNFENYAQYPSCEFKLARIKEVDDLRAKLREAKKQAQ